MANDQSATVKVGLPNGNGRAVYHIRPHDTVDLRSLDLKNTRIDLLGSDMVLTNTQTHSTVVLAQMAIYLFSKDDAPTIIGLNGDVLTPETMLSHVGKVWEFTARDYLGITSLEKTDKSPDEADDSAKTLAHQVETAEAAAAAAQPMGGPFASQIEPKPLSEDTKKFDNLFQTPPVSTSGQFSVPPIIITEKTDPQPPMIGNGLTFTFDARILQVGVTKSSLNATTDVIKGGGAFETAVFDERNSAQYSQEIIDVSAGTKSNYIIYSDNPDNFTDTTATRVVSLTPYLPDGFLPSEVLISGLPAGYSVGGATNTADGWLLTNPTMDSGAIKLPLIYLTGTATTFTLTIHFEATSTNAALLADPTTATISYTITREVDVKPVGSSADGNYTDANGHLVWVLAENENSTKILAGDKTVTVYGGKGVDEVTSGAGDDTIYGNKGDDIISTGAGNDFIQGGDGNDVISGGSGTDTSDYSDKTVSVSVDLASLSQNLATVYVNGIAEDSLESIENINGGSGNDTLLGDAGANVLNGGDGNDFLEGRGGNDTLIGGNGVDTVSYEYATNGVTVVLSGGSATVTVAAGDIDTLTGIENINGTAFADNLTGDANANVLMGGAGNDTFTFSAGADVIDGGADIDTLLLTTATSGVTLNLGTLNGGGYATLTSGGITQTIKGIENITGSAFADTLTGDANNNVLFGGDGNDTLNGGLGDDTLHGGRGSDTLVGGGGNDTVAFDDTQGAVTVVMTGAGAGTAVTGADTDTFSGFSTIYLGGLNDSFKESTGVDRVYGLDGNDTFIMVAGDSSNDYFDGGNGVNTVDYSSATSPINLSLFTSTATGNGTDTLLNIQNVIGTSGNDTIQGSSANNTLDGGAGTNTLSYAYTNTSVVVNLANVVGGYSTVTIGSDTDLIKNFQIITGGGGADTFTGNGLGQTFNGGAGNDTFNGSLGNDTFDGGADIDTVSYSTLSNSITATIADSGTVAISFAGLSKTDTLLNIENLTGGIASDNLTGNASANVLHGGDGADTIYGLDGNDSLYGDAGNDIIYGGNGNDSIYGGDGNDTLYGEAGNDTFYGDLGDDTIDGGAGTNIMDYSLITSAVTIDLRTSPTASGAGSGTDTFTNIQQYVGSAGNDVFYGSSGNDNFNGSNGTDTVYGSNGNDTLNVEVLNYASYSAKITANLSTFIALKDTNNDGVTDYTDTLTGNWSTILTGSFDDTITGGTGSNSINTGAGNDTIIGSRGNDTITGGTGTDTLTYVALGGTINANLVLGSFAKGIDSSTDTVNTIEKLYTGSGADTFQTNGTAFSSYTTIDGGAGRDTITYTSGTLGTNVEAVNFANIFDNIEAMDMRNATLAIGDSFNMTTNDIISLTDSSRTLDVYITTGFNLALTTSSGYTLASDTASGNVRTVTYTKPAETNITLHVLNY